MEKDRQEFEKRACLIWVGKHDLAYTEATGIYANAEVHAAWLGWQARGSSDRAKGFKAAKEQAAKLADKMQVAAGDVLERGHDDDAAAQYDTAGEIAEAIRSMTDQGDDNV